MDDESPHEALRRSTQIKKDGLMGVRCGEQDALYEADNTAVDHLKDLGFYLQPWTENMRMVLLGGGELEHFLATPASDFELEERLGEESYSCRVCYNRVKSAWVD